MADTKPPRIQLSRKQYRKEWLLRASRPRAMCHPERPHRAHGLCNGCYEKWIYKHSASYRAMKGKAGRTWRQRHRDEVRRKDRDQKLRKHYGIGEIEYQDMLTKQGGCCALCGRTPRGHLHVDHDHRNGQVRGLLCLPCNGSLAWLERLRVSPDVWIQKALAYLEATHGAT
jgi:hypothetical protein